MYFTVHVIIVFINKINEYSHFLMLLKLTLFFHVIDLILKNYFINTLICNHR